MPRTNATRTGSSLHRDPLSEAETRVPRTYSVTDDEHNVRDYRHASFVVTDEGELVVLRLDAHGDVDFVLALYADGGWHCIEVADEHTDEPPAE